MGNLEIGQQLMEASAYGKLLEAQQLLKKGARTDYRVPEQDDAMWGARTPLGVALLCWHADVAELLLECGANPNQDETTISPLMLASNRNLINMITFLLKNGAKLNETDSRGWDALHWAIFRNENCLESVETLIQAGIDVNREDSSGETPIWKAMKLGNTDVIQLLTDSGAAITKGL